VHTPGTLIIAASGGEQEILSADYFSYHEISSWQHHVDGAREVYLAAKLCLSYRYVDSHPSWTFLKFNLHWMEFTSDRNVKYQVLSPFYSLRWIHLVTPIKCHPLLPTRPT
jgi:hypothetical protein